jgi:hypothetical protein
MAKHVHPAERKFKDSKPVDGEKAIFRQSGHKSYISGTWDEKAQEVICGLVESPARIHVRYLGGWLPDSYRLNPFKKD